MKVCIDYRMERRLLFLLYILFISSTIYVHGFEIKYRKPKPMVRNTVGEAVVNQEEQISGNVIYSNSQSTIANYPNKKEDKSKIEDSKIPAEEKVSNDVVRKESEIGSTMEQGIDSGFSALMKTTGEVIEFLRTDGTGMPVAAGISWTALIISFLVLSPILLPLILSPVGLLIGVVIFIPTIISTVLQFSN